MPRKRGNNEGSVYKRSDGKWVGAVTLGYNDSGNPKRRVVYGETRAEAAKKLTDLMDKFHKGLLAEPTTVTVSEFAADWLEREVAGKAVNTRRNYQSELSHALRFLGNLRLQAVKPLHVRQMLDRMTNEGWLTQQTKKDQAEGKPRIPKPYTARTQKKALERLSAMFKDAVRLEVIYRNPCEGIRVKAPPSEPVGRTLEPQEISTLMGVCETHPMGLFFRLVLDTGLRKGEALALTWADLDLEANPPRLHISKSWSGNGKRGHLTGPKSRTRRSVPIPPSSAERLKALKRATLDTYGGSIAGLYLFGSPIDNRPVDPNSPNHALTRLCKQLGLTHIRVHDLRHTYGSLMLAARVPLEVVSKRMGHANPTITLNIYRHLLEREHTDYVFDLSESASLEARLTPSTPHTASA